ncbi:HD domain-containing protein [Rhodopseudomonas palustris]|uniref:ATP-binding region, ATPase-like n=1 Tax=Rhodopseudomonas palustris (strain BisB18) TaxID=316056 RepID=Q20YX2_RHOPB
MKVRPYERSNLWRSAFQKRRNDPDEGDREALAGAYRQLRDRAGDLVNQIHSALPHLTVHDLTHADTLWDVASEICGPDLKLNPLEGFVLGASFLLHDAGMALAAYPNGLEDLKKSIEWRDAVASAWKKRGVEQPSDEQREKPDSEIVDEVTFQILRSQHASQAKKLVTALWTQPSSGRPMALIQNDDLLESYGLLIGNIAASHHWPLPELARYFGDPTPASAAWPREWEVDGLLLASILRCADACAIDETRAPSFLFALRRPQGDSKRHWAFQNKIYPAKRREDGLLFDSKSAFQMAETDDWWLCFDAIEIADRELRGCDALLADRKRRPFVVRRAVGAGDPDILAQTVKVEGWKPVNTLPKISDPSGIIERLGGKQLYGDDPTVPIRELIQNSVDAIRARRFVDPHFRPTDDNKYPGLIRLSFEEIREGEFWLIVEDDGVGMSERTVTRSLLDFGTSFWSSSSAAELYPGLPSEPKFKPVGRFGIGFFSVFMYSTVVVVASREFAGPKRSWNVLEFAHGVRGRANFSIEEKIHDVSAPDVNTRVMLKISEKSFQRLQDRYFYRNSRILSVEDMLFHWLGVTTAALDVSVVFRFSSSAPMVVNAPLVYESEASEVSKRLSTLLAKTEHPPLSEDENELLAPMGSKAEGFYGYCCVSLREYQSRLIKSVGGIGTLAQGPGDPIAGIAEYDVSAANRRPNKLLAPQSIIVPWAKDQLVRLRRSTISDQELEIACYHLGELIDDVREIFRVQSSVGWLDLDGMIAELEKSGEMLIPVRPIQEYYCVGVYHSSSQVSLRLNELNCAQLTLLPTGHVPIQCADRGIIQDWEPRIYKGFWDTLFNTLSERKIDFEVFLINKFPFATFSGLESHRDQLFKGGQLIQDLIKIKVR